jgi:hypothetical protein
VTSWVLSSNSSTYNAKDAFLKNGEVDWVTKNNFEVGDIVYMYEVVQAGGRGGIVYKTEVIKIDVPLGEKLDDRKYWPGQVYPRAITERTRFSRLKLVGEPNGGVLSLGGLKERGFTAPQGRAISLDKKPGLLRYIQDHFN